MHGGGDKTTLNAILDLIKTHFLPVAHEEMATTFYQSFQVDIKYSIQGIHNYIKRIRI